MSAEYRITYAIERWDGNGRGDFAEIGFGSSSSAGSVDQAAHDVQAQIQNRQWETEDGMPDPSEVDRD